MNRSTLHLFTFVVGLTFVLPAQAQHGKPILGLTHVDELARVYDAILDARFETVPVSSISRSASVDLPWSMWATIEKLRI